MISAMVRYSSSGMLLASAPADGSYAAGAQPVTFPAVTLAPGTYYGALLFNGTTPPALARASASVAIANTGTSGATVRFGFNATSRTALPSPANLGSSSGGPGAFPFWIGLS